METTIFFKAAYTLIWTKSVYWVWNNLGLKKFYDIKQEKIPLPEHVSTYL